MKFGILGVHIRANLILVRAGQLQLLLFQANYNLYFVSVAQIELHFLKKIHRENLQALHNTKYRSR
jgi:hypothetical protein